ncbi:protein HGH1 [Artemisia annua]|uniref:Protein HGH1 n=1 Tax=Artemisia annua TaxID=35608 RepID=A0A2U1Q111_ARTAN|nr:protein HGH1 [Artemisia annua]
MADCENEFLFSWLTDLQFELACIRHRCTLQGVISMDGNTMPQAPIQIVGGRQRVVTEKKDGIKGGHDERFGSCRDTAKRIKPVNFKDCLRYLIKVFSEQDMIKMPLELRSALSLEREPVTVPEICIQALEAIYLITFQCVGAISGVMDAANLLKPMRGRSELLE